MMGSNCTAMRLLGFVLLGLVIIAQPGPASGQEEPPPVEQQPAPEEKPVEQSEAEPQAGDQPFKLIKMFAEEWKWTPNLIQAPQGTRIRIEFLSYGASRRFDLPGYKLKVRIPQDKTVSVEFVADKKGTFRWKCGRPCGNGCAKMTGKLIVE